MSNQIVFEMKGFTVEVCRDQRSLNTAFRLRYRAYLKVNAIPENEEEMLYDDYDFMPNSFTHLVWYNEKPVATVRGCVFSSHYNWRATESVNYFSKDVEEQLGQYTPVLESNRYAVDPEFQGRQSLFAQMLMFRAHGLNANVHGCTHIITSVRANHIPFYRRFLGMQQLSAQMRYIPWADADVALLSSSAADSRAFATNRGMPDYNLVEELHYANCIDVRHAAAVIAA